MRRPRKLEGISNSFLYAPVPVALSKPSIIQCEGTVMLFHSESGKLISAKSGGGSGLNLHAPSQFISDEFWSGMLRPGLRSPACMLPCAESPLETWAVAVTFPSRPTGISTENVPSSLVTEELCQPLPSAVPCTSTET